LLSTAKDEEPAEELDDSVEALCDEAPPAVPVEEPPAAPVEEPLLEELLVVDAFVVPVAVTVSPTSPESLTIVPFSGA
jgi:hypothetical protein